MSSKRDIESEVTERIMAALERGTVPWSKPWNAEGMLPTSATTGKAYRGVNVWLLTLTSMEKGYGSPYWLTFKQAQSFGGSVRKGEKGTLVVFWKPFEVKDKDSGKAKTIPLLRYYHVWNLDQTENVEMPKRFVREAREPVAILDAVSEVLDGYADGPEVRWAAQDGAYYMPSTDTVTLPLAESFETSEGMAATVFHELTHSTGHPSRLDRFAKNGEPQHFGSARYAREELVAEMGSQLIGANVGVEVSTDNSAAYIASWLRALQDDKRLVISAAQQAQKAADRVLGSGKAQELAA